MIIPPGIYLAVDTLPYNQRRSEPENRTFKPVLVDEKMSYRTDQLITRANKLLRESSLVDIIYLDREAARLKLKRKYRLHNDGVIDEYLDLVHKLKNTGAG